MRNFTKIVCVIVDAYSTGRKIAPALIANDYKCIHIQSSNTLPKEISKTLIQSDFIKSIIYAGNINQLMNQLNGYQIKLCVAGYESGVELADALAERLNLPNNGTLLSKARRDKWLMSEVISKTGLLTAKSYKSNNPKDISNWINKENILFPIVIKPLKSANGDQVYFCYTENEIYNACQKIINSTDCFGEENKDVLVQPYLDGQEYIVNSVSYEEHFIAEIWRVNRKGLSTIYDYCEIIYDTDYKFKELTAYTKEVLNALGIKYGAATTELKYTSRGIALIECASRLMGGAELSFTTELFGFNQLSLMITAYLNPMLFLNSLKTLKVNSDKIAVAVLLISNVAGVIQQEIDKDNFEKLPTLFCYDLPSIGYNLQITVDSLTTPGVIYLMGKNKDFIKKDYQKIRDLEKKIYKIVVQSNNQILQERINA